MRRFYAYLLALSLAACSAGGVVVPQSLSAVNSAKQGATPNAKASFKILIPPKPAQARPRFVSPSTHGAKIVLSGPSKITLIVGFEASSPGCSTSTKGRACVVTIPVKACPSTKTCYTSSFVAYDRVSCSKTACSIPATAQALSADRGLTFTVASGKTAAVSLSLGGIPKTVVVVPGNGSALSGTSAKGFTLPKCEISPQPVTVFGADADGNTIVGPGAPTSPTLASNDAVHLAVATPSPGEFKLVPPASLAGATIPNANSIVQLTAGITPAAQTGSTKAVSSKIKVTFNGELCFLISHYSNGISSSPGLYGITSGPDGNLWFTEQNSDRIARITTAGTVTEFSQGITASSAPRNITLGPDHKLWFTEGTAGQVGRITTGGTITEYSVGAHSNPEGIATGPDGNLWVAQSAAAAIAQVTTGGVMTEFTNGLTSSDDGPVDIVAGPDGNLWFTDSRPGIGRITTTGAVTVFTTGLPLAGALPDGITAGPDGNLWFTDDFGGIGKVTTNGVITEYTTGLSNESNPNSIVTGPDGNLWFAAVGDDALGRITTSGAVTEFPTATGSFNGPTSITLGPDGALWFTERAGTIGRMQ